jgi:hypothetical protein
MCCAFACLRTPLALIIYILMPTTRLQYSATIYDFATCGLEGDDLGCSWPPSHLALPTLDLKSCWIESRISRVAFSALAVKAMDVATLISCYSLMLMILVLVQGTSIRIDTTFFCLKILLFPQYSVQLLAVHVGVAFTLWKVGNLTLRLHRSPSARTTHSAQYAGAIRTS